MKKVICFSIWGDQYRYTGGVLQNIELAKVYYPDWICRFYVGKTTPKSLIEEMDKHENVEMIFVDDVCDWTGMFWRFLAASDPDVEIMISRDADSRLHQREKAAVDAWLDSDLQFHIMRDHPYHNVPILGGMWGAKKGILPDIKKSIDRYQKGDFKGVDQNFLTEHIYPIVRQTSMVHDEFFERKPFPITSGLRTREHFVGQAYDGDGKILDTDQYGIIYIQDFFDKENVKIKIYDWLKNIN